MEWISSSRWTSILKQSVTVTACLFLAHTSRAQVVELPSKIELAFTGCPLIETRGELYIYSKDCVETFYTEHPSNYTNFNLWNNATERPIGERLHVANLELLQYLALDNLIYDYPHYENIQAVSDPVLVAGAVEAIKSLPPEMERYINKHFYGFILVSGVGWTGFAMPVRPLGVSTDEPGAVIILNADNFQGRNLDEWLTFREETAFNFGEAGDSRYSVRVKYNRPGKPSTLADNFQHFLIHETAHLVATARPNIHPDFSFRNKAVPMSEFEKWGQPGQDPRTVFRFLQPSWWLESTTIDGEKAFIPRRKVPHFVSNVLKSKRIRFYGTDPSLKFSPKEAKKLYLGMNSTCFPSLYAMMDYTEDFAETVTHYFMTKKLGYIYTTEILLEHGNRPKPKPVVRFRDNLWSDPRCREKVRFMDSLFSK